MIKRKYCCKPTVGNLGGLASISDSGVLVSSTGTTATLRSLWKDLSSSGWIEGFEITDAGGETVNVAAGEFIIRSGATATSPIYYENSIAGLTGVAIPTDSTRYLIGSFNSGAPNISFGATDTSNGYSLIYLGEVHNRGGVLKIHPDARPVGDFVNRAQGWAQRTIGDRVSSGLVTYDPAAPSRKIAVTAGAIEVARSMDREPISLFDSNAGGTFTAIYGTGTYTYVAAQTEWDNTQYDNAGVLTAMTLGWYSNRYVIQGYLGDVSVQYGRAQYATEAEALAEAMPSDRPEEYMDHGMVIAKITFLKSAASPSTISDLRPVIGSSAPTALAPTSHPNLTGLAWGGSGHTGTAGNMAGFDSAGDPISVPLQIVSDFRLTLEPGVPVSIADQTAKTSIYATPYTGNRISLFDGTTWVTRTSAEFSLALGVLTANLPYDVFAYDNAGTPTLEFTAWTNGTTRATALVRQDGVLVKTGALTRRYLGSFYTTSTTTTEDSVSKRRLWNYYHRVDRTIRAQSTTASYIRASVGWRLAGNDTNNQADFIIGVAEDAISAENTLLVNHVTIGTSIYCSIGLDSTGPHSDATIGYIYINGTGIKYDVSSFINTVPSAGYHYIARIENQSASTNGTYSQYLVDSWVKMLKGTIRN